MTPNNKTESDEIPAVAHSTHSHSPALEVGDPPRVVLVVGTPRSGTSAITGALQKAGISTAARSWVVHKDHIQARNPKGTWECSDIYNIMEKGNLYVPPYYKYESKVNASESEPASTLIKRYVDLRDNYTDRGSPVWAGKDPRLTFLGIEFLRQLGERCRIIFTSRAVQTSAKSYAEMRGYTWEEAITRISNSEYAKTYLYHTTPVHQRLEVKFPELISDTERTVGDILRFVSDGIDFAPDLDAAVNHITQDGRKVHTLMPS